MPENFPEIWESRVRNNITTADQAPFLDGIAELDAEPIVLGQGSASEKTIIHIPISDFDVEILINNNTYPLEYQEYEDGTVSIAMDKYQPKVITLNDDQTIGAAYDRIDNATRKTVEGITKNKFAKAVHSLAPQSNTADTPVLFTSGEEDATGRKLLTYEDLVRLKDALDKAETPDEDRRLVLCSSHWNDLLLLPEKYSKQLIDYRKGQPAPVIAGFEIFKYIKMPMYTDAGIKKAYGSIADAKDVTASIVFYKGNIAKKTGITKQYFVAAKDNPSRQSNDLSYRHYYVVLPIRNKHIGAII